MTSVPTTPLITASELAEQFASGRTPTVVDVRWTLAGADRDAYRAGHVPGAVFLDLDADLAGPPGTGGRHPLPDPADLQRTFRAAGIDDDSTVVVYDARDSSVAARAWWLLRFSGLRDARVLDGGFAAWSEAGRAIEAAGAIEGAEATGPAGAGGGPRRRPGSVTVRAGSMPVVDADDVAALAAAADSVLLDARAANRYRGEVEPIDPVAGHIPGAVSLPFADLLASDGRFRPVGELRRALVAAGVTDGVTAAASCGSGVTACHLILAGEIVGIQMALYPGSYSQWCALGRPVATGR